MTRTEHTAIMRGACAAGGRADQEFARACAMVGIDMKDALIGSPLLNIHIAQKRRHQEKEHARYLRDKAVRRHEGGEVVSLSDGIGGK